MEKRVRFHEIAHARLINIAKETPVGQKSQATVLPRKRGMTHGYYENKIFIEHSEDLVPVRLRPKRPTGVTVHRVSLQPPAPSQASGPRTSRTWPLMSVSINDQRVIYPEPSRKPKAPRTFTNKWDEVEGAWKQQRSVLGRLLAMLSGA